MKYSRKDGTSCTSIKYNTGRQFPAPQSPTLHIQKVDLFVVLKYPKNQFSPAFIAISKDIVGIIDEI